MTEDEDKLAGDVGPFGNMLVVCTPFEDNQQELANAGVFADAWGADLSAIAVFEPPVELDTIFGAAHMAADSLQGTVLAGEHMQPGAAVQEIVDRMTAEVRERLVADWTQSLPDRAPTIAVKTGKPFVEIVRHVIEAGNDMVVKTAEEIEGLRRYLFSSTDRHLLREAPCPVWLWKPQGQDEEGPARVRSIVAAVDVNAAAASEPDTLTGLNRRIVQTAARIAAGENAEVATVTVLHVWDALEQGLVRRWSGSLEVAETYVQAVEANHERDLNRLVEDASAWAQETLEGAVTFVPRLERGVPRGTIPEFVQRRGVDLLVMGTIARTGVPGFFIGNTAEDILSGIDCSVVTVKPPGFVGPLKTF